MSEIERYPMQEISSSENSRIVCGAKTRSGGCCKNNPVTDRKRCRMHGGKSLSGENHPNYKHGFYTKAARKERSEALRMIKDDLRFFKSLGWS